MKIVQILEQSQCVAKKQRANRKERRIYRTQLTFSWTWNEVSCVRIMCWLINTHRLSALFGWAPGSARRAQRHWKPHKYVREKERDIEWGSCGDRALAEPTQHYLNSRAVCVCHMLHGKFQPETHCCWGVELESLERFSPLPTSSQSHVLSQIKLLQWLVGSAKNSLLIKSCPDGSAVFKGDLL